MSENDKSRESEGAATSDEGVALSPYDSDLRAPDHEVSPGEIEFPTPAGYDDAADGEGDDGEFAPLAAQDVAADSDATADGEDRGGYAPEWAAAPAEGSEQELAQHEDGAAPEEAAGYAPAVDDAPAYQPEAQDAPYEQPSSDGAPAYERDVEDVEPYEPVVEEAPPYEPVVEDAPVAEDVQPYEPVVEDAPVAEDVQPYEPVVENAPVMEDEQPYEPVIENAPVAEDVQPYEPVIENAPVVEDEQPYEPVVEDVPPYEESPVRPARTEADYPPAETEYAPADESPATTPIPAAAAAAGLAAGAPSDVDRTRVADPISDTAVRRTSLLHPERTDLPSNEPTRLRADEEADARADNYGTTVPADESALFAGAQYDRVPSRVGAHIWSIVAAVLLLPVAWYLISDAGARMTLVENAQWTTGTMNIAALAEMVSGLLVLVAALQFARVSPWGAFVMGTIVTIIGGTFVVAPAFAKDVIAPAQQWLRDLHAGLGGNIAHHLEADGSTGRILALGVILIVIGVISAGARGKGREEQRIRAAVERRQARTMR